MLPKLDIRDCQQRVALHNDPHAYKQLFVHFYDSLTQFAFSYLKNRQLAEDAVSDVFIKIWEHRSGLLQVAELKLYLFTSTKNTALNYLRRQAGHKGQPAADEDYQIQLHSIYYNPERLMMTTEMLRRIQGAISQLPPKCQLIFKLVKEDGLKYKEVATLLNLSQKTVENQMTIALKKMGEAIPFDRARAMALK